MTAPDRDTRAPLLRFTAPHLNDIRRAHLARFRHGFRNEALVQALWDNPRMEPKLLAALCKAHGQPPRCAAPEGPDAAVIGVLVTLGSCALAELAGAMIYRRRVLDWLTWGQLEARLPQVDQALLRHCLRAPQLVTLFDADSPPLQAEEERLTYEDLLNTGSACLAGWSGEVPVDQIQRLLLFATLPPARRDQQAAARLRALAEVLLPEVERRPDLLPELQPDLQPDLHAMQGTEGAT